MAFEPNHKEIEAASREKGDVMPATAAATRETKAKCSATLDSFYPTRRLQHVDLCPMHDNSD